MSDTDDTISVDMPREPPMSEDEGEPPMEEEDEDPVPPAIYPDRREAEIHLDENRPTK